MRILVIDDELPICELLNEFLSMQGYQVTTTSNGEEAVSLFEAVRPHVVLLDIKMPGVNGIEVLQNIKEIDGDAAVIMLSAFGDTHTVERTRQIGATNYLEKPIELGRLNQILKELKESCEIKDSDDTI